MSTGLPAWPADEIRAGEEALAGCVSAGLPERTPSLREVPSSLPFACEVLLIRKLGRTDRGTRWSSVVLGHSEEFRKSSYSVRCYGYP